MKPLAFERVACAADIAVRRHLGRRPLPTRCQFQLPPSPGTSSSPAGLSAISAKARITRSFERRLCRAGLPDCPGKPQPFGAVIIAVLEQMLDQRHPQPAAQPRANRITASAPATPAAHEGKLQQGRIIAARKASHCAAATIATR